MYSLYASLLTVVLQMAGWGVLLGVCVDVGCSRCWGHRLGRGSVLAGELFRIEDEQMQPCVLALGVHRCPPRCAGCCVDAVWMRRGLAVGERKGSPALVRCLERASGEGKDCEEAALHRRQTDAEGDMLVYGLRGTEQSPLVALVHSACSCGPSR